MIKENFFLLVVGVSVASAQLFAATNPCNEIAGMIQFQDDGRVEINTSKWKRKDVGDSEIHVMAYWENQPKYILKMSQGKATRLVDYTQHPSSEPKPAWGDAVYDFDFSKGGCQVVRIEKPAKATAEMPSYLYADRNLCMELKGLNAWEASCEGHCHDEIIKKLQDLLIKYFVKGETTILPTTYMAAKRLAQVHLDRCQQWPFLRSQEKRMQTAQKDGKSQ